MNPLHVLARGRTYRRAVHLMLGAVVLLPYVALAWLFAEAARTGMNPVAVVSLALLAIGVGVGVAVVPGVRALGVTAARALLDIDAATLPDPAPGEATAWRGRLRAAAWLLVNMLVGGVVATAILLVVPTTVGLLMAPWEPTPPLPTGAAAWWAPAAGVLLAAALVLAMAALGGAVARLAPRLLGPAASERLAAELDAAHDRADRMAERARLARELHDSVGHALTVTTLQAGAAAAVLDTDRAFVARALGAIEQTGRTALDELDHVLGLLRDDARPAGAADGAADAGPRDLRALDALVDGARSAGVAVDLHRDGDTAALPAVVSREAYRLVQEALTNALRHAGPVPVTVALAAAADGVRITVDNPLPPGARAPRRDRRRGGRGLRGMAERVDLLGGEFAAGPSDDRWRLSARLPGADRAADAGGGSIQAEVPT